MDSDTVIDLPRSCRTRVRGWKIYVWADTNPTLAKSNLLYEHKSMNVKGTCQRISQLIDWKIFDGYYEAFWRGP